MVKLYVIILPVERIGGNNVKQDDINTLEKLCKLYLDNLYIFNNDINELGINT